MRLIKKYCYLIYKITGGIGFHSKLESKDHREDEIKKGNIETEVWGIGFDLAEIEKGSEG